MNLRQILAAMILILAAISNAQANNSLTWKEVEKFLIGRPVEYCTGAGNLVDPRFQKNYYIEVTLPNNSKLLQYLITTSKGIPASKMANKPIICMVGSLWNAPRPVKSEKNGGLYTDLRNTRTLLGMEPVVDVPIALEQGVPTIKEGAFTYKGVLLKVKQIY